LYNQFIEELNLIIEDSYFEYLDLILQNVINNFSLKDLDISFSSSSFKLGVSKSKVKMVIILFLFFRILLKKFV
jgi:hypothetical protein